MSYQDVKDRLYHGHRRIANNTNLTLLESYAPDTYGHNEPDEESIGMRLHGNMVARFYPDHLELYSAGWHTTTTKNRLNLALELAGISGKVVQEDYTWFLDIPYPPSSHMFKDGVKISYNGEVI